MDRFVSSISSQSILDDIPSEETNGRKTLIEHIAFAELLSRRGVSVCALHIKGNKSN